MCLGSCNSLRIVLFKSFAVVGKLLYDGKQRTKEIFFLPQSGT